KVEVEKAEFDKEMVTDQLQVRKESLKAATARVEQAEKAVEVIRKQEEIAAKAKASPSEISQLNLQQAQAVVTGFKALEAVEKKQVEIFETSGPKLAEQALAVARAKFKAATATLDEANRALEECTLKAPADGTILRLDVAEGGVVAPGSPIPFVVFA